jgi:pimeloyl-ACP methyl ester carboxylesterase
VFFFVAFVIFVVEFGCAFKVAVVPCYIMVITTELISQLNHLYLQTNGITLHVVEAGPEKGPLVILLHGFPEFWYGWRYQIEALADAGFRVLAPDQRGYNLSDKPRGISAYNPDELAADIIGLIDAVGREKAYVAGHDWGGAVAWWTAVKYPQRLEKLIILWSQPGAVTGMFNWYRASFRSRPQRVSSSRLTAPALVIWGTKDKFLDRELAEQSIGLCDDGQLVYIDNATYWMQHEEPVRVNELLCTFF